MSKKRLKNQWRLTAAFGYLMVCSSAAGAAAITAETLVNDAYTDGGFIASATTCNLDQTDISRFASQQEANALNIAKNYQLTFDSDNYNQYVTEGFESTMELIAMIKIDAVTKDKNCVAVDAKLKRRLEQKLAQ